MKWVVAKKAKHKADARFRRACPSTAFLWGSVLLGLYPARYFRLCERAGVFPFKITKNDVLLLRFKEQENGI